MGGHRDRQRSVNFQTSAAKPQRVFRMTAHHYNLKSPSFCSRSQAETPHIFCVLPLSDEFRERITFCGSHEKFGKCLAQRICNEAQRGATGARRACQAHRASGWPTISRGARPQKNDKELVTLEYSTISG